MSALEGFLLLQKESFPKGKRTVKTHRTFCALAGSVLRCYVEAEADLNGRYDSKRPTHTLDMQACVEIYVPPHGIEESIAKMLIRKKNNDPISLEIKMHWSKKKRLVFIAQAGGSVAKWVRALRAAMWKGEPFSPPFLRLHAGHEHKEGDDGDQEEDHQFVLKVLLDKAIHPERKNTVVARQKMCPRGIVLRVDASVCSSNDLCNHLGKLTGLPPGAFVLMFLCSQGQQHCVLQGWKDLPLTEFFQKSLPNHQGKRLTVQARVDDRPRHWAFTKQGRAGHAFVFSSEVVR